MEVVVYIFPKSFSRLTFRLEKDGVHLGSVHGPHYDLNKVVDFHFTGRRVSGLDLMRLLRVHYDTIPKPDAAVSCVK